MTTILIFVIFSIGCDMSDNSYEYISGREDHIFIEKDKQVIIEPTIVDVRITSEYIVGLRLPIERFDCNGGYKIKIVNRQEYFLLLKDSGEVFNFTSRNKFEAKLTEYNILGDKKLDYSKFSKVWERHEGYYKNIDYSSCEIISSQTS
jgi:hypothetical protein